MESKKHRSITSLAVLAITIIFSLILPIRTLAQMTVDTVRITNIDYSAFPEVSLKAIIRDGNNKAIPVSDLEKMEVLENGEPVNEDHYQYNQINGGIELIFVLDLGQGINSSGATKSLDGLSQITRLLEMQRIVQTFSSQMTSQDTMGVITVEPDAINSVKIIQPLTSDSSKIKTQINNLSGYRSPAQKSRGLDGIQQALEELKSAQSRQDSVIQSIIFISSGIQTDVPSIDGRIPDIITQANKQEVAVHTILVNITEQSSSIDRLQRIAEETRGLYTHYDGDTSMNGILSWVIEQCIQYEFKFRSTSSDSSDRTVTLHTKGAGAGQEIDTINYSVNVKEPIVEINNPKNADQIIRQAESYDQEVDTIDPKEIIVTAGVRFPDGFERNINLAQLWVNNSIYGSAVPFPDPNNIQIPIDLTQQSNASSEYPLDIKIQIQDELGLSSTSDQISTKVIVSIPDAPSESEKNNSDLVAPMIPCDGLVGYELWLCKLNSLAGWVSLVIALTAMFMVIVFRGRISGAAIQVGDAVRETIARITRPPQTEVGAYLTVLRGAEDLPRNKFPIYINTVTPIGRDKRQAELVFDETAERSVISRLHAEITESAGVFTIRDLGSSHGTFVNGHRLAELGVQELKEGDIIELGPVERGGIQLAFEASESIDIYPPSDGEGDLADRITEPMV
jgi:hypothetical protein